MRDYNLEKWIEDNSDELYAAFLQKEDEFVQDVVCNTKRYINYVGDAAIKHRIATLDSYADAKTHDLMDRR